ncbi:RNA polymerase sigma factor [Pedobacter sp. L105]|uniref:RNA polymerase sigma factor n=1 Tax=Pedobacter sp. L105 TaxID=1641871 RepID=UPI00131AFC27|nr:sigma-70 family RNA polymerase sigma factor [Pedobacter sp. L105]
MQIVTDTILLEMLKKEEDISFKMLYNLSFDSVSNFIRLNSGTKEDAEDVFQETIVILLEKLRTTEFKLSAGLKTYLFAIAKNIWFKRLRERKISLVHSVVEQEMIVESFETEIYPEQTNEQKMEVYLQNITTHCRWIIRSLFYLQFPIESLMETMGWKNKHTANNQKYKCVQMIRKEMLKQEKA